MSKEILPELLVKYGVIDRAVMEDPEGYDNGWLLSRVRLAEKEFRESNDLKLAAAERMAMALERLSYFLRYGVASVNQSGQSPGAQAKAALDDWRGVNQ